MAKCPGQDQRFWKPKDIFEINCPDCSTAIEFWKDDPQVKCHGCKKMITNPRLDISCAKWCKYAKECLGVASVSSDHVLCNTLVEDMKTICRDDHQRIDHALETLKYAELIQANEGGNPLVTKAAAILSDAFMQTKPDQSHDPVMAKDVLGKHGIDAAMVEQVSQIITACRDQMQIDSVEFRIVSDALQLVKFQKDLAQKNKENAEQEINKTFKTQQAKQLARQLFE